MKLLLYIIITFFCFSHFLSFGQKANTKSVYYTYLKPPKMDLPDNVQSYFVKIINEAPSLAINCDEKQAYIKIDSMERAASEEEADLLFKIVINSSSSDHVINKENYKKKINDSTSVEKTGGRYSIDVNLIFSYSILDKANNQVLQKESGKTFNDKFTSNLFDTYNQAVYHSNEHKNQKITSLENELFQNCLNFLSRKINDDYGFSRTYMNVPIARGRGRHDYKDLEEAYNVFDATTTAQNSTGLDEHKIQNLKTCIATWENAIKEYEPGKRKARISDRNIGHIHFNVAIAKFMIRDWEGALKMLEVVQSTKGQKLMSDYLYKEVIEMQSRYANIGDEPVRVTNVQTN